MDAEGRYSVAFPRRHWYPACQSSDLGSKPLAVELMETPVVVFRDGAGAPHALVDRCPHRNAPLSLGRVASDGSLQCGYHGWCFDGAGTCTDVPGLDADAAAPNRAVPSFAVTESDGFVWIWGEPGGEPAGRPFALPALDDRRVGRTVFVCDVESTMHASIENALDVPHTAFLHGGIFRGRKEPREITAIRRELPDGLEVQYVGEPLGFGPLTLDRSQTEKTFDHWDRFFLPGIAQIEYGVDGWIRIFNTILHLPMAPFRTRAWFVLDYSSPLPASIAGAVVRARGPKIMRQDADMLAAQTATARRFGGERYTSTELDLLGRGIWRLLRQAERAETSDADEAPDGDAEPVETTVTLRI
ncbi:Rieske 2Fe-2S domain-containing protein [Actinospongicola halichondriae]|uniref:Rieske 2Fe-2S domain-containing protein n=1 Tax=Actinospongicola halichondriae TaxID=3236844 RepID=UPI003D469B92